MADSKNEIGIVAFPGGKRAGKPDIAFGKALREYRLRAHMEQEQLAEVLGVTVGAVYKWEAGDSLR